VRTSTAQRAARSASRYAPECALCAHPRRHGSLSRPQLPGNYGIRIDGPPREGEQSLASHRNRFLRRRSRSLRSRRKTAQPRGWPRKTIRASSGQAVWRVRGCPRAGNAGNAEKGFLHFLHFLHQALSSRQSSGLTSQRRAGLPRSAASVTSRSQPDFCKASSSIKVCSASNA
jgi:hypothetical protein